MVRFVSGIVAVLLWETLAFGAEPERVDAYGDPLPQGAVLRLGTIRFRHAGISDFSASADGSVLATVAPMGPSVRSYANYSAHTWDAKTGHRFLEITHTGPRVALSPDGNLLAAPAGLWNTRSGEAIVWFDMPGRIHGLVYVAFSADGSRLLVARGSIFTWDVRGEAKLADLKLDRGADLSSVAISADGQLFATMTGDFQQRGTWALQLWRTDTCELVRRFHQPQPCVSLSFSPDGRTLSGTGHLWDVESGDYLYRLDGEQFESALVFWPKGHLPSAASTSGEQMTFWDVDRARVLSTMKVQTRGIQLLNDGKLLLTAGDAALWFLDPATGDELPGLAGHHSTVTDVRLTPDGRSIVSASSDATVRIWDVQDGTQRLVLRGSIARLEHVAVSPDGRFVAARDDNEIGSMSVWELESGKFCWQSRLVYAHCMAFSSDSRRVLVHDNYGNVETWEAASGAKGPAIKVPETGYREYAFSPNATQLAITRENGLSIFAVDNGEEIASAKTVGWATAMTFNSDGTSLAVASHESTRDDQRLLPRAIVQCVDVASGKLTEFIDAGNGEINEIAFSPDGRRLAAADNNHLVRLWEVESNMKESRFKAPHLVKAIAFSADGKRLVTGGDDATLLAWDLERLGNQGGATATPRVGAYHPTEDRP